MEAVMVHSQANRSRTLRAVAGHRTTGRQPQPTADAALDIETMEAMERIAASSRWDTLAACRDEDPELFFPVGTSGPAQRQEAEAKAVCARCPVEARCLKVALESGDDYGVRGGMTEGERRALIRAAKKPAAEESAQETQPRRTA
jgi:WhiB family transcriptional regulator, redox-sensing transcriptional regulator